MTVLISNDHSSIVSEVRRTNLGPITMVRFTQRGVPADILYGREIVQRDHQPSRILGSVITPGKLTETMGEIQI